MSRETLWKGFEGIGLYAQRANKDKKGNVIDETYETKANVTAGLAGKVDKVPGKGLSTEDYTTEEKTKLNALPTASEISETYATKSELPDITVKADKVTGGIENHVISLDSTGNIKDSGIPAVTAAEGTSSLVVTNTTVNNATTTTYEWKGWTSKNIAIPQEFVDIGGKAYPIVKIGNYWFTAQNLDYLWEGCELGRGWSDNEQRANYYSNDKSLYGNYGLLYNYKAAEYLQNNRTSKNLLPAGWRVAGTAEWNYIIELAGGSSVAGRKFKTAEYNGTNDYGFSLIMGGYRSGTTSAAGQFMDIDQTAIFQTGEHMPGFNTYAYCYALTNSSSFVEFSNGNTFRTQGSIRLVKDA